jgi:Ras-related protein Rab-1A
MITSNEKSTAIPFKIIIIGDSCTGKSSLLLKLVDDSFTNAHKVTIGVDFKAKYLVSKDSEGVDKIVKLKIWDTAGQERFRSIIKTYYAGTHGIILTFDLTNLESFEHLQTWMEELTQSKIDLSPIMLVGTKSDLETKRTVHKELIDIFITDYTEAGFNIEYVECSSKLGSNVKLVFQNLADKLMLVKNIYRTESEKLELSQIENNTQHESTDQHYQCCTIS